MNLFRHIAWVAILLLFLTACRHQQPEESRTQEESIAVVDATESDTVRVGQELTELAARTELLEREFSDLLASLQAREKQLQEQESDLQKRRSALAMEALELEHRQKLVQHYFFLSVGLFGLGLLMLVWSAILLRRRRKERRNAGDASTPESRAGAETTAEKTRGKPETTPGESAEPEEQPAEGAKIASRRQKRDGAGDSN